MSTFNIQNAMNANRVQHRLLELLKQLLWQQNTFSAHTGDHPDRNHQVSKSEEGDRNSSSVRPKEDLSMAYNSSVDRADQITSTLSSGLVTDDNLQ